MCRRAFWCMCEILPWTEDLCWRAWVCCWLHTWLRQSHQPKEQLERRVLTWWSTSPAESNHPSSPNAICLPSLQHFLFSVIWISHSIFLHYHLDSTHTFSTRQPNHQWNHEYTSFINFLSFLPILKFSSPNIPRIQNKIFSGLYILYFLKHF